jgi:Protein involved in regulation of cellular morphogenesis/cytokinesis
MDRSNSTSSTSSKSATSASGPFAYQTRLLERTSSRGGGGSLSRSNSQSSMGILSNPNGSPATPTSTRRWTPSHRVGSSLDAVRGKWEERAREVSDENIISPSSPSGWSVNRPSTSGTLCQDSEKIVSMPRSLDPHRPPTPPSKSAANIDQHGTPTYSKRHTMPAPIIASPLSPNTTGVTVEADSPVSAFVAPSSHRIHLPVSATLQSISTVKSPSRYTPSPQTIQPSPPPRNRRSNTMESVSTKWAGSSKDSEMPPPSSNISPQKQYSPITNYPIQRRPSSLHGSLSTPASPNKYTHQPSPSSTTFVNASSSLERLSDRTLPPTSPSLPNLVMTPNPYRSSYMANKKTSSYGSNLNARRKLGRHLPRIASGDGDGDWDIENKDDDKLGRLEKREQRARDWENVMDLPQKPERVISGVTDMDDVAGVPGRLRLARDKIPSAHSSPLPSSRLTRGLWADAQRHLLQAYEYLCHVGEAQQWIEGCLGEELEFGVVEMEDGLRNGVVLAKLVRAFQGESVVRRIYEVRGTRPAMPNSELWSIPPRLQSWISVTLITSITSSTSLEMLGFPK